jgi:hypothetical protein
MEIFSRGGFFTKGVRVNCVNGPKKRSLCGVFVGFFFLHAEGDASRGDNYEGRQITRDGGQP